MSEQSDPKLGINSWLEDELYQTYLHDRKYVDESWKTVFEQTAMAQPAYAAGKERFRLLAACCQEMPRRR